MKKVAVIMGSDSDWNVMKKTIEILKTFSVPFEIHVFSAHRTPEEVDCFSANARKNGFGVIIAGAGMSAALAGVVASKSILPVIGVPLSSKALGGMDALLSTSMMPPGVPVGSMGIEGAKNAAIYAMEILALEDESLVSKLLAYRKTMHDEVLQKDKHMQQLAEEL